MIQEQMALRREVNLEFRYPYHFKQCSVVDCPDELVRTHPTAILMIDKNWCIFFQFSNLADEDRVFTLY